MTMTASSVDELRAEIERAEEAYEFLISYAGKGVDRTQPAGTTEEVRSYLDQLAEAMANGHAAAATATQAQIPTTVARSPSESSSRTIGFASAFGPTALAARTVVIPSRTPCDVKIAAASPVREPHPTDRLFSRLPAISLLPGYEV